MAAPFAPMVPRVILLHFPNPEDSPTGASPVRLRYRIDRPGGRPVPVLTYRHGADVLSRQAFAGFEGCGAWITAEDDRERQVIREALGHTARQPEPKP